MMGIMGLPVAFFFLTPDVFDNNIDRTHHLVR